MPNLLQHADAVPRSGRCDAVPFGSLGQIGCGLTADISRATCTPFDELGQLPTAAVLGRRGHLRLLHNPSVDKPQVLGETFGMFKLGGRFAVSDVVRAPHAPTVASDLGPSGFSGC